MFSGISTRLWLLGLVLAASYSPVHSNGESDIFTFANLGRGIKVGMPSRRNLVTIGDHMGCCITDYSGGCK